MFEHLGTSLDAAAEPVVDPAGFVSAAGPVVDLAGLGGWDPVGPPRPAGPEVDVAGFAEWDPVGFLSAATEAMAKLPSQLWRTGNDGFAAIVAGMDALEVQLGCARVGLVGQAESRGVVDQST